MSKLIVSLLPKNYEKMHYIEPFCGALNVFFKKRVSKIESVNDINKNLYLFYKVLRDNKDKLKEKINNTMYCEHTYKDIKSIYHSQDYKDEILKAWATFVLFNSCVQGIHWSGFGYNVSPNIGSSQVKKFTYSKIQIDVISNRLQNIQIFNRDANWFIDRFKDERDCIMYLDPPYPETDQAYDAKFNINDFNNMLEKLYNVKFKFLLSFYEKDKMNLNKFEKNNKFTFFKKQIKKNLLRRSKIEQRIKVETILCNYKSFNFL